MFTNSFYQLHLDVINSLTNALKLERVRLQETFDDPSTPLNDTIFKDILAMLHLPLLTNDMIHILDKVYNTEYEDRKT